MKFIEKSEGNDLNVIIKKIGINFLRYEQWKIWKRKRSIGYFTGIKIGPIKLMIGWTKNNKE